MKTQEAKDLEDQLKQSTCGQQMEEVNKLQEFIRESSTVKIARDPQSAFVHSCRVHCAIVLCLICDSQRNKRMWCPLQRNQK